MRTVYIQVRDDGEFPGTGFFAGWRGFTILGYDVRKFTPDELPSLDLSRRTIVHGALGTVHRALERIGVDVPPDLNVPPGTEAFLGRGCWSTTLGQIRELRKTPVFIKPLFQGKIFAGHVVESFGDLVKTVQFGDDCPILAQDAVRFVSEWRAFVLRGSVVGIGHYKGDPLRFPSGEVIERILRAYEQPVAAHTLDVGVTADGTTLLVEMNDAYAFGDYGLPSDLYARMVEARWDEMCGAGTSTPPA